MDKLQFTRCDRGAGSSPRYIYQVRNNEAQILWENYQNNSGYRFALVLEKNGEVLDAWLFQMERDIRPPKYVAPGEKLLTIERITVTNDC